MDEAGVKTAAPNRRRQRRSARARFVIAIAWLLLLAVLAESVSLGLWIYKCRGLNFTRSTYIFHFYPELKDVAERDIRRDDEVFDILLLAGSVLDPEWSSVPSELQMQLGVFGRPVRIHTVTQPRLTSIDSLHRYEFLRDKAFDLVVFYHGVNDAEMNNCPPEFFHDDYSQSMWYLNLSRLPLHPRSRFFTLPATLRYLWVTWRDRRDPAGFIPDDTRQWTDEHLAWQQYGKDVKTAGPFERNIEGILRIAAEKREPVLLMSFAYYLAPGYTHEKFMANELDYGRHRTPIRLWGVPEYVTAAVDRHNQIIRDLAERSDALYVDQEALMPEGGNIFDDLCHLTVFGSQLFVRNIVPVIQPLLEDPGVDRGAEAR